MSGPAGGAILTVGHSTLAADAFMALLVSHGIRQLADVRTVPRSRRHPHFAAERLGTDLPSAGIGYRHFPELGGLRRSRPDSPHTGWQHPSFRAYADHMDTAVFRRGLDALLTWAAAAPTAVMCAEALWWQCHRRLLADALLARGIPVRHVMGPRAEGHALTPFARLDGDRVMYPGLL